MKTTRNVIGILAAMCLSAPESEAATIPGTSLTPSVWLDAGELQLWDGDAVHPWPDMSGNERDATATNPLRAPIYRSNVAEANGQAVVRFNSEIHPGGVANQFLQFTGPLANTEDGVVALYAVVSDSGSRTSINGRATFVNTRSNGGTADGFLLGFGATPSVQSYAHLEHRTESGTGETIQATPVSSGGFNVIGLTRDNLTSTLFNYTDTDEATTTTTWGGFEPSGLTATQVGTEGGSHYLFGDIAEIIVIEGSVPTAEEHIQIVQYLGEKYDIVFAANASDSPEGYTGWAEQQFGPDADEPAIAGPGEDPDADGLENFLEYALGADPQVAGVDELPEHGITEHENEAYLTLVFSRPIDLTDVVYQVQASADLGDWSASPVEVPPSQVEGNRETVTFRDTVPVSEGGRRFLRLNVSGK